MKTSILSTGSGFFFLPYLIMETVDTLPGSLDFYQICDHCIPVLELSWVLDEFSLASDICILYFIKAAVLEHHAYQEKATADTYAGRVLARVWHGEDM